jgi:phenylpyruvate tautomerase PptA (4-oxalocrotonate tautomerase family)
MARKPKPLIVELYVGDQKIEALTEEQKQRIADRLSERMSDYYTQHPEEYAILKCN